MSARLVVGMAVPFGVPTLIGQSVAGKLQLFREQFDRLSFRALPARIPWKNRHDKEEPLGWAKPAITDSGLEVQLTPLDTVRGRDAVEEANAGARIGLSIGFIENSDLDEWSRPHEVAGRLPGERRPLPMVTRRGAELVEVSLVSEPAYPTAQVLRVVDRDDYRHQQSEAAQAPWRAEAAAASARSRELKDWADTAAGRMTAAQRRAYATEPGWIEAAQARQAEWTHGPIEQPPAEPELDALVGTELVLIRGRSVRVTRPEYRGILYR